MRPLKSKISITVDSDVVQRIKKEAEKTDYTFSRYINIVLKEHIGELEKGIKLGDKDTF